MVVLFRVVLLTKKLRLRKKIKHWSGQGTATPEEVVVTVTEATVVEQPPIGQLEEVPVVIPEEPVPAEEVPPEEVPPEEEEDKICDKSAMCHFPPGNKDNPQDICVSENAVKAHEKHGDKRGSCNKICKKSQFKGKKHTKRINRKNEVCKIKLCSLE